jgi:Uma2 family endonuclease
LIQGSEEGFLIVPGLDLFIIEVADSSLLHDRTQKARLYARHDVRGYWIVDLNGRRILVHRRPEDGEYQDVRSIEAEEVVSPDASGMVSFQLRLSDLG